jgi:transcription initiation factor TFIIIB Brf1 subunit/transcription initiation factor TFIIB
MSDPTALVLDDCCYYDPDCCPSSETGDSPIGMYDEDLAKYKGDIYCEGCGLVINDHLTDYHEAWGGRAFGTS